MAGALCTPLFLGNAHALERTGLEFVNHLQVSVQQAFGLELRLLVPEVPDEFENAHGAVTPANQLPKQAAAITIAMPAPTIINSSS
jgi:hypothetical protein